MGDFVLYVGDAVRPAVNEHNGLECQLTQLILVFGDGNCGVVGATYLQ